MHRFDFIVLSLGLAACAPEPQPHSSEAIPSQASSAVAAGGPAADFKLAETPRERLGTAPEGFGLRSGAKAPDATLPDIQGKSHRLADLYAKGPTLIFFYRGGWCPFCNLQIHEYAKSEPEFERRGVQVIAISVDQPSEEAKTEAKHGVPFLMLSDSKLVAHEAFHVIHVPEEAEQKKLAGYGIDLSAYSGENHGRFAVPSIFLVDRDGVVRFTHVDEDYKTRPSAKEMLEVIDRELPK